MMVPHRRQRCGSTSPQSEPIIATEKYPEDLRGSSKVVDDLSTFSSDKRHRPKITNSVSMMRSLTMRQSVATPSPMSSPSVIAGNILKEAKTKRQSMLTKFTSSLSTTHNDSLRPFTKDYFPEVDPTFAAKCDGQTVERLVDLLHTRLQTHFNEPLGRHDNAQLCRILEHHIHIKEELVESESHVQGLRDELTTAHEVAEKQKEEIENLRGLYLSEIKRIETELAHEHGLEKVTLMRTRSILEPQDRKSTRRKPCRIAGGGPAYVRSYVDRGSARSREESPLHQHGIPSPASGSPLTTNDDNQAHAQPMIVKPKPIALTPTTEDIRLCTHWSGADIRRRQSCGLCQDTSSCKYVGDDTLLPVELSQAVIAMKLDESLDARIICRAAEIIGYSRNVASDVALQGLIGMLQGVFDAGCIRQLGTQNTAPEDQGVLDGGTATGWLKIRDINDCQHLGTAQPSYQADSTRDIIALSPLLHDTQLSPRANALYPWANKAESSRDRWDILGVEQREEHETRSHSFSEGDDGAVMEHRRQP